MGGRAPRRVSETQDARGQRLTKAASDPITSQTDRPGTGRDHRCPQTSRTTHNAPAETASLPNDDPKCRPPLTNGTPAPPAATSTHLLHDPG
jgi:hypothetical protein